MIELYINGVVADIEQKQFTYNMQVNDMFDFDTREVSYSDSIYLPATATNRNIFGFADVVSSMSDSAYSGYSVDYYVNGMPILQGGVGYLMGKRGDYFIFEFKDVSILLYQYLQGRDIKGLKGLLDDNSRRDKRNIANISESDNLDYKNAFMLADYGDDSVNVLGGTYYWQTSRAPLSISLAKVFNLVASEGKFTFKGNFLRSEYWKNTYISSSNITYKDEEYLILTAKTNRKIRVNHENSYSNRVYDFLKINDNEWLLDKYPEVSGMMPFVVKESGHYRVTINLGKVYRNSTSGETSMRYGIYCSNSNVGEMLKSLNVYSNTWENLTSYFDFYADKGDMIGVIMDVKDYYYVGAVVENVTFKLEKIKSNDDINTLVSDLPLIDLFRNIFKIFGITPIYEKGVYTFYTLDERMYEAPMLNWSGKFVKIKELKFHSYEYAKKNNFLYKKYDDERGYLQSEWDSRMFFSDEVLVDRKDFSVGFYSPFNERRKFENSSSDFDLERMEFFSKEEKIENGFTNISYKEKTGRWHIFSKEKRNKPTIIRDTVGNGTGVSSVWVASSERFKWSELLRNYYKTLHRLLDRPKIITAEFALSEIDIYEFSFFSRIYVDQLGGYFLPNKIKYKAGAVAEVEMIKIN